MGFHLYLMGHGSFQAKNESLILPRGYYMHFYSHHGVGLPEADLQPILRGQIDPVRTFWPGERVPNYEWHDGEKDNWPFYVTGGADTRKRPGLSPNMGPNNYLNLATRDREWDVRYVQHFKGLAGMMVGAHYTLKTLMEHPSAQRYFATKGSPVYIHSLLCSSVHSPGRNWGAYPASWGKSNPKAPVGGRVGPSRPLLGRSRLP